MFSIKSQQVTIKNQQCDKRYFNSSFLKVTAFSILLMERGNEL